MHICQHYTGGKQCSEKATHHIPMYWQAVSNKTHSRSLFQCQQHAEWFGKAHPFGTKPIQL